ncbi:transposase [Ktedonospora formicarum]
MSDYQKRKAYPSDLTDEQWERLESLLPPPAQWSPRE